MRAHHAYMRIISRMQGRTIILAIAIKSYGLHKLTFLAFSARFSTNVCMAVGGGGGVIEGDERGGTTCGVCMVQSQTYFRASARDDEKEVAKDRVTDRGQAINTSTS